MWLRQGVLDGINKRVLEPGMFVHELSHLLQDIATIYGVVDFINLLDVMSDMRRILKCGPLSSRLSESSQSAGLWLHTIKEIRAAANPRSEWKGESMWAYESHRVEEVKIRDYRLPQVVIRFVDNVTNSTYEHALGAWEIAEAYSIATQALYGDPLPTDPTDGFEYFAVERYLQSLGIIRPEHVIAICHWALQHVLPGVRLVELVKMLSTESALPTPDQTYDLCRDYAREAFRSTVWQCESQLQLHIDNVRQTAVSDEDPLYCALCWYRDTAIPLLRRSESSRFPLDTALCSPLADQGAALERLLQVCPVPMIEDATGVYTLCSHDIPARAVFLIRAIGDLMENVDRSWPFRWECPFYSHCNLPIREERCRSVPWTKASQKPTCDYGTAAKYLDVRVSGS